MSSRQVDRLEGTEQVSIVSNCEEELPKRLENHFGIYNSDIHENKGFQLWLWVITWLLLCGESQPVTLGQIWIILTTDQLLRGVDTNAMVG